MPGMPKYDVKQKIARSSAGYTAVGLLCGAFYREYSRWCKFDTASRQTQLRTVHTHCFALGTLVMLVVLVLEHNFKLSAHRDFKRFYGLYHSGLGITVMCMMIQGALETAGKTKSSVVTWIAGAGHIMVTAGLFFFHRCLSRSLQPPEPKE